MYVNPCPCSGCDFRKSGECRSKKMYLDCSRKYNFQMREKGGRLGLSKKLAESETDLYICTKCGTEIKVPKDSPEPICKACGGKTVKVVVI